MEIAKSPTATPITTMRIGSMIDARFFVVFETSSSKKNARRKSMEEIFPVSSPTSIIWMTMGWNTGNAEMIW